MDYILQLNERIDDAEDQLQSAENAAKTLKAAGGDTRRLDRKIKIGRQQLDQMKAAVRTHGV